MIKVALLIKKFIESIKVQRELFKRSFYQFLLSIQPYSILLLKNQMHNSNDGSIFKIPASNFFFQVAHNGKQRIAMNQKFCFQSWTPTNQ